MSTLWRLFFCVAAVALLAHGEEDEGAADYPTGDVRHGNHDGDDVEGADEGGDGMDEDYLKPDDMKNVHSKIDKNGDGKISLAEVLEFSHDMRKEMAIKQVMEYVEMMDKNKDGKISLKEFVEPGDEDQEDAQEGLSEQDKLSAKKLRDLETGKFKIADKNGDGFLDTAELPTAVSPEISTEVLGLMADHTLDTKDKDKDGELTMKEFWASETAGESMDKDAEAELGAEFKKLDLDGNGKLNIKEIIRWENGDYHVSNAISEYIAGADADKDSQLSFAEVEKNLKALQNSDAGSHFSEWIEHRKTHNEL